MRLLLSFLPSQRRSTTFLVSSNLLLKLKPNRQQYITYGIAKLRGVKYPFIQTLRIIIFFNVVLNIAKEKNPPFFAPPQPAADIHAAGIDDISRLVIKIIIRVGVTVIAKPGPHHYRFKFQLTT